MPVTVSPSGLVTAVSPGLSTITATHQGVSGSTQVTVPAPPPPILAIVTSSLPPATVGVLYSQTLQAAGGVLPYAWGLASGALPAGLTLSLSGVISGTPLAAGTSSFTVRVTDTSAPMQTATLLLVITVNSPPPPSSASLIFRSGFQPASGPFNTVLTDIFGIDSSVGPPNSWDALNFLINYEQGGDRFAKIIDDPTPGHALGNRVLHFWLRNPDDPIGAPAARVSSSLTRPNFTEAFQRVRMYIHPDIWLATSAQRFMFQEFWIRPNWTGQPNSFSMPFEIDFNPVAHTASWRFQGREVIFPTIRIWEVVNTAIQVPIGEWFTAETYYKMGNVSTGRILFTIQRAGQLKQVVADVTNWTYHPEEAPQGIFQWHPQKLYGKAAADAIRAGGGVLQIYWDDWEFWNKVP